MLSDVSSSFLSLCVLLCTSVVSPVSLLSEPCLIALAISIPAAPARTRSRWIFIALRNVLRVCSRKFFWVGLPLADFGLARDLTTNYLTTYQFPCNVTHMQPTRSERQTLMSLLGDSYDHNSGGSYHMLARHVKGSRRITGVNRLTSPARLKSHHYNPIHGMHAELHLIVQAARTTHSLFGGTLYIAGVRRNQPLPTRPSHLPPPTTRSITNTAPCKHCLALLKETGIRHVVYFRNGVPTKTSLQNLLAPTQPPRVRA